MTSPANTNKSPHVETWADGDGDTFAGAIARVLVRRALAEHEARIVPPISEREDCLVFRSEESRVA